MALAVFLLLGGAPVPGGADTLVLNPGRAIATWPSGLPAGELRPVVILTPGWNGVGPVDATVTTENLGLVADGYVTLAIGFDSTAPWKSDT